MNYIFEDISTSTTDTSYLPGQAQYQVNVGSLNGPTTPTPESSTAVGMLVGCAVIGLMAHPRLRSKKQQ